MEEVVLDNWEAFESVIKDEQDWAEKTRKLKAPLHISDLLFRGHANREWTLSTTLERFYEEKKLEHTKFTWKNYHQKLRTINPFFSSFTDNNFEVNSFDEDFDNGHHPPCYPFMVHIRHHGFPSPLLDWTKSPYVAAFFAFEKAREDDIVAIYLYREYAANGKGGFVGEPTIRGLGPYMNTHKRHYAQQCQYTICMKEKSDNNHEYCSHELAEYSENRDDQDFLRKYTLPASERKKVLQKLDLMNINSFSLFGNEESMLSTLAYREIEIKN